MIQQAKHAWKTCLWALAGIFMAILITGTYSTALASEKQEAQSIVDKSKGTLADLMSDELFSWLRGYLKTAKGVLIFPQIIKGGFFLGGSGGTGVLLVRNEATGTWSNPAFYTLGSVTFGLQIGGEAAEVVMVAVNQKAIDSLLSSSVKLGGDVSIAIGPIGGGAKGALTVPEVTADFVSFTKAKGLYGGLNLEGAVMAVREGLNTSYYGKGATPATILMGSQAGAAGAYELRSALERAVAK
jgi:lipid-binding SYLF domain-containing protein